MEGGNGTIGIPVGIFLDASRFGAKNLFFWLTSSKSLGYSEFIDKP